MTKLGCTFWQSVRDPAGKPFSATWERLAERFAKPIEVANKTDAPGWAPVSFVDHYRVKANVKSVYAPGFDFDELDVSFDELCGAFHTAAIVHTTYSHMGDVPRARAFLRLSRPISADEHARLWPFLAERMREAGQAPDPAAKDPSRLWFVPSVPIGKSRYYRCRVIDGPPLDVDSLLARIPEPEPVEVPAWEPRPATDLVERARRYLARCDVAVSGQRGHNTTFVVASKLVRGFGLDVGTAFALMSSEWNLRCQPPWSQSELIRKLNQAADCGRMPVGELRDAERKSA